MARTQQELLDEIAGLKSAIQADSASDQDVVNTLDALVADLRAQVAAGQAIDTEALFAAIDDAKAQIQPATSMTEPPTP